MNCKPVCYWHMVTHLANQENYSPLPKLGLNDANYKLGASAAHPSHSILLPRMAFSCGQQSQNHLHFIPFTLDNLRVLVHEE